MSTPGSCLVLTYHSISDGPGPTNIPPEVFAMQMAELAESGCEALTLDGFIAWQAGGGALGPSGGAPHHHVLITFDDAFRDFAEVAAPVLEQHDLPAVVFVPTGKVGAADDWESGPRRGLMDWDAIAALQRRGFAFGSHSRTHRDLCSLSAEALAEELAGSRLDLAEKLGGPVRSFAAPFGRADARVRRAIAGQYEVAFGTRLALAEAGGDRYDIPRIDMHYFRGRHVWRNLLEGKRMYLWQRQALRAVRERALRIGRSNSGAKA